MIPRLPPFLVKIMELIPAFPVSLRFSGTGSVIIRFYTLVVWSFKMVSPISSDVGFSRKKGWTVGLLHPA